MVFGIIAFSLFAGVGLVECSRFVAYLEGRLNLSVGGFRMADLKKPGERYEITGPRGGPTGEERTVTKGERFPPTPKPGQKYQLNDPTKHKPGRK
jgi:hypothetical protein